MLLTELEYWPRTYFLVGTTAFLIAALAMPLGIIIFRRLGMMDPLSPNKIHKTPVPRGGGIIIFAPLRRRCCCRVTGATG